MRIQRQISFWFSLCYMLACSPFLAAADDELLIGVAEEDITPPEKFPIAGYYHERLADGTIDPLKAKAIVFRQGKTQAAIVICDLTGIAQDLCHQVRMRVHQECGIPYEAISLAATHSHTAPDYSRQLYRYLKNGSRASDEQTAYIDALIRNIALAVTRAHQQASPAEARAGMAMQVEAVAFNRRFVMRDGSQQTWKSLNDPNVVRAAGPIDPSVEVLGIYHRQSQQQTLVGTLTNFALHLDTVGGLRWSADYPYFIEQKLRQHTGNGQLVSLFGNGCCGDINHVDPTKPERNKSEFIGKSIGMTAVQALGNIQSIDSPVLQSKSTTVPLPLQALSPEELNRAIGVLQSIQQGAKVEFLDQVKAYKQVMIGQMRGMVEGEKVEPMLSWGLTQSACARDGHLSVPVHAITLGDEVAIVCLPGEVFVDLGLAIKRASRFRHTLVIELSNAVETAYLPTVAAAAGGSYEVTNSTTEPGSGEMLVSAAIALLRK